MHRDYGVSYLGSAGDSRLTFSALLTTKGDPWVCTTGRLDCGG
jgi:hypothetical protein